MTAKKNPRRGTRDFQNSAASTLSFHIPLVESYRAFVTSEALSFARKVHQANPAQTTTAIFDFQRSVWRQFAEDAVSEAELFYMLEGGEER